MLSIQEVEIMLDEIAEEMPRDFYKELNGGISLLPEVKYNEYGMAIMGEYHYDYIMGRYIYIYYGSFSLAHGNLSPEQLRRELKKTLVHEFTHHLESLGGEQDLAVKDAIQLQKYLDSFKNGGD